MEFQSSLLGLAIIIVAWILLLIYSKNGKLRYRFLIMYSIGTALLVIDSLINSDILVAIFNLIILGLACAVSIKISKAKKEDIKPIRKKSRKR
jgi:hypothetical protein